MKRNQYFRINFFLTLFSTLCFAIFWQRISLNAYKIIVVDETSSSKRYITNVPEEEKKSSAHTQIIIRSYMIKSGSFIPIEIRLIKWGIIGGAQSPYRPQ